MTAGVPRLYVGHRHRHPARLGHHRRHARGPIAWGRANLQPVDEPGACAATERKPAMRSCRRRYAGGGLSLPCCRLARFSRCRCALLLAGHDGALPLAARICRCTGSGSARVARARRACPQRCTPMAAGRWCCLGLVLPWLSAPPAAAGTRRNLGAHAEHRQCQRRIILNHDATALRAWLAGVRPGSGRAARSDAGASRELRCPRRLAVSPRSPRARASDGIAPCCRAPAARGRCACRAAAACVHRRAGAAR